MQSPYDPLPVRRAASPAGPLTTTRAAVSSLSIGWRLIGVVFWWAHLTTSAPFQARAPGPVSGQGTYQSGPCRGASGRPRKKAPASKLDVVVRSIGPVNGDFGIYWPKKTPGRYRNSNLELRALQAFSEVARPGLEPGTPRFSVVCSTN